MKFILPLFGKIKPVLNRWQIVLHFSKDFHRLDLGWKVIRFGVLKFHSLPSEGEMYGPRHYYGWVIRLRVFIPVELE